MEVALSRGLLVLLLYLQIISAQQKTPCNAKQNSGINYNIPQGQVALQQLPQQNVQQDRMKQNQVSDIMSALHNLRSQVTYPTFQTVPCGNQNSEQTINPGVAIVPAYPSNQAPATSYVDPSKPTFSFQFVPASSLTNIPQQSPQTVQSPTISSQPYYQTNPMLNPQSLTSSAAIPVGSSQTSPVMSQPIVFTLQSPQSEMPQSVQNQPAIVYTMQPQQSNQQTKQSAQSPTASGTNDQSIMSLLMSQLQSPNGNPSASSMLPALLTTKQEKSSMKALLPLILNLLNEKRPNCCQCGCPTPPEPTVHSGYSIQKDYSKNAESPTAEQSKSKSKHTKKKVESEELSEEEEEYEDEEDDGSGE